MRLPSRGFLEPPLIVVTASLAFGAHAWVARFGLDLVDEGYFLDLAARVMHGQLPYRDFDSYYTPGIFYLNAAVLSLFGSDVLPARLVMVGLRIACAVLVYVLARRIAMPPFAAVPALMMVALGVLVGQHPGWPSLLATLLLMESLARAEGSANSGRRALWLAASGAAAAVAFALKQNVGAFALAGALGYVFLRPRDPSGLVVFASRVVFAVGLALVTRAFLGPSLNPLLSAALWLPLVATLGLLLAWAGAPGRRWHDGLRGLIGDSIALLGGAVMTTALWLVPLSLALGIEATPYSLFLGSVNQGALDFPLEAPPRGAVTLGLLAIWTPLGIALAARARPTRLAAPLLVAVLATALIVWLPTRAVLADPLATQPAQFPRLATLDEELGSLLVYLPSLFAWSSLLLLSPNSRSGARPPLVSWFLLIGTAAALALYPRADNAHVVLAGAPLLVVGAWVLMRAHAALTPGVGKPGRAAIFAALLVVPVAAATPHLYGRYLALAYAEPDVPERTSYVSAELDRATVLLPETQAVPLREAIGFLTDHTAPGDTMFAYPVDPMVNFLTDRPNPTRFDHFIPGALSADDMAAVVADLETALPRYVLWDHGGVVFWRTDQPNRVISDYIWRCYRQVAAFRLYLVLERSDC